MFEVLLLAQPSPYDRAYSFIAFQAANPLAPLPSAQVELELNRIKLTLDALCTNIALIQRDDGELTNASVGLDQLDASAIAGLAGPASKWVTGTVYAIGDSVFNGLVLYVCVEAHTSGTFVTDLGNDLWSELADFTATANTGLTVTYDNGASGLAAENVQDAIDEIAGGWLPKSGGTMTGAVDMGSQVITALATPTDDTHAANKAFVDSLTIDAPTVTRTANYTMLATDAAKKIDFHTSLASLTYTLLPADDVWDGFWCIVQKTNANANTVTIDPDGSELINNAANYVLTEPYEAVIIRHDGQTGAGHGWFVIATNKQGILNGDNTFSGANTFSGTTTHTGAVVRTGRQIVVPVCGNAKAGATAGWVITAGTNIAHATLPAGETGSTLVIPLLGLEVGNTLTAVAVTGQVESGGNNVTLTMDVRKLTSAAAALTDASLGTDDVGTLVADTELNDNGGALKVSGLSEVIGSDESVYVLLTGTTAAATDIDIMSVVVTVTRS